VHIFSVFYKPDQDGDYDTYKLIAGSSVTTVDIYAEWDTLTFDPISIYLWDKANKEWSSSTPGYTTEPDIIPREFGVTAGETYYIGVQFIDPSVVADTSYTLVLHAKP